MDHTHTHTHTRAPTKPRNASTYIRVCGSSIKQKLKGEKLVTTSEKGQPAGHGPGKSIEKFERKVRRGDASKLNKKNGESQNSNSVSTSLQRPATPKNREILNENCDHASDDCKNFRNHYVCNYTNFRWEPIRSRTPKGANAQWRTQ